MTKVIFDPKKHKYFIDDREYPSVTTILSIIAKPALIYWGVKVAVEYLSKNLDKIQTGELQLTKENATKILTEARKAHVSIKDEAGEIGKQVHAIVEKINKGKIISDTDWEILDIRVQNAVSSYKKWCGEVHFTPLESEIICYSKEHEYAGTIDSIGKIDGKLVLVDYKTSNSLYDEYFLQTAAYYMAYKEMFPDVNLEGIVIVRFSKNTEEFEMPKQINTSEIINHYNAFLSALNLWRWKDQTKNYHKNQDNDSRLHA